MKNKNFLISIILPVYNCEKYISYSIKSILSQSHKNFELLIIDDGSFDNTKKIIKKFKDKRIKFFENDHNGLLKTLIYGLKNAKGQFIARMDADDISHRDRIKKQLEHLLRTNSDICGCGFYTIDNNSYIKKDYEVPIKNNDIKMRLALSVPFCHGSIIAKADIFKKHPYGTGNNNLLEDYSLWIRMNENGVKFTNIKEKLYYLREHPESLSKTDVDKFRINSLSLGLEFISKNQEDLIKVFQSKKLLDFLLMNCDSSCRDYLYTFQILTSLHKFYSPIKHFSTLLTLLIKVIIYKVLCFSKLKYNLILKKLNVKSF